MAKRPLPKYDFKAFGAAIKAARTRRKESRKKVSDEMFISPRYLDGMSDTGIRIVSATAKEISEVEKEGE